MLTALAIQNAKPRNKPYLLTDGNGLHLVVKENGSKLWRLRYRFGGKQNMISLGPYPDVSLAAARAKRDDARKLLTDGKDPSQQRKEDRLTAAVAARNTFRAVAEEVLAALEESNVAVRTMVKNRWLLLDLAAPLADRPVADVTPAEVLAVLKKVEKSGRRETAKRLRAAMGRVFRLAVATCGRLRTRPTPFAARSRRRWSRPAPPSLTNASSGHSWQRSTSTTVGRPYGRPSSSRRSP